MFQRELAGAAAAVRPHIRWRIAWCYFESGDPSKANCDWVLGASLSRLGMYEDAAPILEGAEQTFFALTLLESWVEVRLARVECHMAAGHDVNIRGLLVEAAETSIELDEREPSRRHHATADAMAYLREQAMHETVTTTMVEYVGRYVHQAHQRPVGRFTPPRGAQIM